MKEQILEKLDEKIAKAEKVHSAVDPETYSYRAGYWKAFLEAREIVLKTEEEDVKHG